MEEEGGLARSFLREFRVLVGTSRFLEREVDVAVRDWFASEDLEVCFEILPERVVLVASMGMVEEGIGSCSTVRSKYRV